MPGAVPPALRVKAILWEGSTTEEINQCEDDQNFFKAIDDGDVADSDEFTQETGGSRRGR